LVIKKQKYMRKVIVLGGVPAIGNDTLPLRVAIANTLARMVLLTVNDRRPSADYLDAADALIDIFGEDKLKDLCFKKEIESIEREFKLKSKDLSSLSPSSIEVLPEIDTAPWYTRFEKKPRKKDFIKKKLINPRIFKKGTRKKWIPSFFYFWI